MHSDPEHARYKRLLEDRVRGKIDKLLSNGDLTDNADQNTVTVPVDIEKLPRLRFKDDGETIVYGDGDGSGAGDKEGEDVLDVEFDREKFARIMGEELKLRDLKSRAEKVEDETKERYKSISVRGPNSLRHMKRSYRRALKRQMITGIYNPEDPVLIPIKDDFRYRSGKPTRMPSHDVVKIFIRDVSGSMDNYAVELVRRVSYPIDLWIDHAYKNSTKVYIAHDVSARVVNESTYYRIRTSGGGTRVAPAYRLALELILKEHKGKDIYVTHLTDGDILAEQDGDESCAEISNLLKVVNQFSLIQIPNREMRDKEFQSPLLRAVRVYYRNNFPPSLVVSTFKGGVAQVIRNLFGVKNGSS